MVLDMFRDFCDLVEALMYNCLQLENITKGFMDGRMYQQAD